MATTRRTSLILVLVLALIGSGLLAAGLIRRTRDTSTKPLATGKAMDNPVPATLSLSRSSRIRAGEVVAVNVQPAGTAKLASIALYDNGSLLQTVNADDGRHGTTLNWPALRPGNHTLSVVTTSEDGSVGTSQTVGVTVDPPTTSEGATGSLPVEPDDTVEDLQSKLDGLKGWVPDPKKLTAITPQPISPITPAKPPELPATGPAKPAQPGPAAGEDLEETLQDAGYVPLDSLDATIKLANVDNVIVDLNGVEPVGLQPSGKEISIPAVTSSASGAAEAGDPAQPEPAKSVTGTLEGSFPNGLQYQLLPATSDPCKIRLKFTGKAQSTIVQVAYSSASRPTPRVLNEFEWGDPYVLETALPAGTGQVYVRYKGYQSPPLPVVIPASCIGTWEGNLTLIDGILTLPENGGNVFLYINQVGKEKNVVRVPVTPQATLVVPGKVANVSSYLPAFSGFSFSLKPGDKMRVEAWRSTQGGKASQKIATGTMTLTNGQYSKPSDMLGGANAVTLQIQTGDGESNGVQWGTAFVDKGKPKPINFRWMSEGEKVGGVLWQVLRLPLGASNVAESPVSLLASGYSAGGTPGFWSQFTIPAAALDPGRKAVGDEQATPGWLTIPTSDDPDDEKSMKIAQAWKGLEMGASGADIAQVADNIQPGNYGRVYIRVLPLDATQALTLTGATSNLVNYDPPAANVPDLPEFDLTTAKLMLPPRANFKFASCIRVTKLPYDKNGELTVEQPQKYDLMTIGVMRSFYPQLGTYCPDQFFSDYKCDLACELDMWWDVATNAWDYIAAAYNSLISKVSSVVAKFNPICLAAGAAGAKDVANACEGLTEIVAHVALDAVLTSVGLPPTLPTSSQVVAIAQGNLEQAALTALDSLGVPCSNMTLSPDQEAAAKKAAAAAGVTLPATANGQQYGVCEVLVHVVAENLKATVSETVTNSTVAAAGMPAFPGVVGFEAIPEPTGRQQPATIVLTSKVLDKTVPKDFPLKTFSFSVDATLNSYWYPDTTIDLYRTDTGHWLGAGHLPNLHPLGQMVYGTKESATLRSNDVLLHNIPESVWNYVPF